MLFALARPHNPPCGGRTLGAALYDPVWTSAVQRPADFALALLGFILLVVWRVSPLVVVALGAAGGIGMSIGMGWTGGPG